MLNEDRKSIIEAEEHYRHEIAKKLRADLGAVEEDAQKLGKSFWDKVIEVFNSNFGLWFLSSVFITGGAALYQITQHHYDAKLIRDKAIITCEFEIANRLNGMKFLLLRAKTVGQAQFALTPITKSLGPVSSEYENVNIAVLYFKIFQLTGQRDIQIGDLVRELEEKNLLIQSENPKLPVDEVDRKRLIEIIDALHQYEIDKINKRNKP
ncbi:hypothetical protein [Polynucleobacter sp.]|uniref:hypothetical protein n=1 Tax=Polynucleobacter sp. TaxID=2029855 RepID=UPI0033420494